MNESEVLDFLSKCSELNWDEYPALFLLAETNYDKHKAQQYIQELGTDYIDC